MIKMNSMRIIPMNDSHRRILRNTIICTVESLTGKLYDRKTWQATGIAWQYYQAIPAVQNSGFFSVPLRKDRNLPENTGISGIPSGRCN